MVGYNNNEGIGGFQQGSYCPLAIHPIEANWTRQSRFRAPTSLSVLKRVVDSGRPDFSYGLSSFTVDEQGRAILAVGQGDFELNHQYGKLFRVCFESDTVELLLETKSSLMSPLLISPASILVATNSIRDNQLISVDENGRINWKTAVDGVPYGRPVVNSEGHIYLCTYEDESQIIGRLYAFDADGTIRWVYKCSSIFWCDPVISREGIIYIGQNVNSKLYAFSPDGELLWEKRMGQGEGHRPPVIDQDGVMYGCLSSQLYAIAPDGEVKWIYQPEESYVDNSPSLGADGNLYVNLTGGEFICLTRDGEQLWRAETKGFAITQPILGRCGNVIQSRLMDNSIESYSVVDIFSQKGVHLAETAIKGSIHSVILANDEVIYVLSSYWTAMMEPKWELHLQISIGQSQGWTTVLGEKFNWETIGEGARSLSNLISSLVLDYRIL